MLNDLLSYHEILQLATNAFVFISNSKKKLEEREREKKTTKISLTMTMNSGFVSYYKFAYFWPSQKCWVSWLDSRASKLEVTIKIWHFILIELTQSQDYVVKCKIYRHINRSTQSQKKRCRFDYISIDYLIAFSKYCTSWKMTLNAIQLVSLIVVRLNW